MKPNAVGLGLVAAVVLVAGCSPQEEPLPPAEPRVLTSGRCPGEAEAAGSGSGRGEGHLTGDVDGDGAVDTVFLVETAGPANCSAFVVVETGAGIMSAPLPLDDSTAGSAPGLPSLTGLAEIDGRAGADVYVTVTAGASTSFLSVFSAASGRLVHTPVKKEHLTTPFFPSGGSVGHIEASDCAGDGVVSIVTGTPKGDAYALERVLYRARGDAFVVVRGGSQEKLVQANDLERVPEFARTPFGSCAVPPN